MTQFGMLSQVTVQPIGSCLVATAAVAATGLTVAYAGAFDRKGGTLDLNGARLEYTGITDGVLPEDPDVITLAVPLAVAGAIDDLVSVVAGGEVAQDYRGHVSVGEGDDVQPALPLSLRAVFPVGLYADPVPVYLTDDYSELVDAPSRAPVVDGLALADDSVPGSALTADAIDGKVITGAFIRTAATGNRWEIQSTDSPFHPNTITGFTGYPGEDTPALVETYLDGAGGGGIRMTSARLEAPDSIAQFLLMGKDTGSYAYFIADLVSFSGGVVTAGAVQANGGARLGSNGSLIAEQRFGDATVTVTAAASGTLVVNHGLGGAPTNVQVTTHGTAVWLPTVFGANATQFTISVRHVDGASGNATVPVYWDAKR
jgi:hypothetical protein